MIELGSGILDCVHGLSKKDKSIYVGAPLSFYKGQIVNVFDEHFVYKSVIKIACIPCENGFLLDHTIILEKLPNNIKVGDLLVVYKKLAPLFKIKRTKCLANRR